MTGQVSVGLSTLSAGGSPASPSRSLAGGSASRTIGTPGQTPCESFARWDRGSSSWRTYQLSLLTPTTVEFSVTWTRAGSTRSGRAYRRPPLERLTRGKGSGSWPTPVRLGLDGGSNSRAAAVARGRWPTPRAHERGDYTYDQGDHSRPRLTLTGMARRYPTPTGAMLKGFIRDDAKRLARTSGGHRAGHRGNELLRRVLLPTPSASGGGSNQSSYLFAPRRPMLQQMAREGSWPTPTSSMMTTGDLEQARFSGSSPLRPSYGEANQDGGQLNPTWVEWLMGWPLGWTDLRPLAMDRFLSWLRQFSGP